MNKCIVGTIWCDAKATAIFEPANLKLETIGPAPNFETANNAARVGTLGLESSLALFRAGIFDIVKRHNEGRGDELCGQQATILTTQWRLE